MKILENAELTWIRRPCEVDGSVVRARSGVIGEQYDVMNFNGQGDDNAIWGVFAALNEDDPESIRNFCSQYGLLGLYIGEHSNDPIKSEKLEDIRQEIVEMRRILETIDFIRLYRKQMSSISNRKDVAETVAENNLAEDYGSHLDANNIDNLKATITDLFKQMDNKSGGTLGTKAFAENPDMANHGEAETSYLYELGTMITLHINCKIGRISPALKLNSYNNEFQPHWMSDSLLDNMYLLIFLELIHGNLVKKCENANCGQYFSVSGGKVDKKYCSQRCAHAQASREYRSKKASEKAVVEVASK